MVVCFQSISMKHHVTHTALDASDVEIAIQTVVNG